MSNRLAFPEPTHGQLFILDREALDYPDERVRRMESAIAEAAQALGRPALVPERGRLPRC